MATYKCKYLTYENHKAAIAAGDEVWLDGKVVISDKAPKRHVGNFGVKSSTCEFWFVSDRDGVNVYDEVVAVDCSEFSIN